MKLNFSNTEDIKAYEPVPRNRYLLTITRAVEGVSKANNKKMEVDFTIADGEHKGRQINFTNFGFTEAAMPFVKNFFKALGFGDHVDTEAAIPTLRGRQVYADVVVKRDADYGDSNQIKVYYSVDSTSNDNDDFEENAR